MFTQRQVSYCSTSIFGTLTMTTRDRRSLDSFVFAVSNVQRMRKSSSNSMIFDSSREMFLVISLPGMSSLQYRERCSREPLYSDNVLEVRKPLLAANPSTP